MPIIGNHVAVNLGRWWLVIGAFVATVTGLVLWASSSDDLMDKGDKLSSILGPPLAVAGLFATVVFGVLSLRTAARARSAHDSEQALEDLARLVTRQWEREAGSRGLTRQDPLEVRWASTARPVAASAAEVIGASAVAGRPVRLKLRGGVGDLADALRELPSHQLVVLGEPGSGKTSAAMLLTLALLEQRQPGDLVPVLFSLATWDPTSQDLDEWMVRRLAVDHPVFRDRGVHGPKVARELVERGLVLPVLDAVDEVALKVDAVRGIARVVGRNKPMVLTCRADDYEEIIRETGVPVGRAAVVELKPVSADEAARYLEAGTPEGDGRWRPVSAALRADPDGTLARALSTPLAVYLAKTAFTPPKTDPADLLTLPTSSAVEHHLLEAYLPALYPAGEAAKVRRRFAFLARRLAACTKAENLAWWRLVLLLPRPLVVVWATRTVLVGVMFGGIMMIYAQAADERVFLATGVLGLAAIGSIMGLAVDRVDGAVPLPRSFAMTWWLPVKCLLAAAGGVLFGMAVMRIFSMPTSPILIVVAAISAVAPIRTLTPQIPVQALTDPRNSIAGDRRVTLWTLAAAALSAAVFLFHEHESSYLGISMFTTLTAFLSAWLLFGAWANFTVVRFWFAVSGKLPWRLLGFLEDAHRRGVLRRVGAAYEFRHQRLQQHFSR